MRNSSVAMAFCLAVLSLFLFQSEAFFQPHASPRSSSLSMMFGKKALEVSIKVDGKTIVAFEKSVNLRKELMANKVDIYPLKAKVTGNCGGAGICGTCAVKVLAGKENMSPMSKNEINTLAGKPADWRLSCCARVTGPISIKTKP
jgi:ferredoxin